jgi:hypothetical protein
MSVPGVSAARVTIAAVDLRSVDVEPGPVGIVGGIMRTFSTVRSGGIRALMTAGEVPGGSEERCNVGFAATLASLESFSSSSSSARKADAASADSLDEA